MSSDKKNNVELYDPNVSDEDRKSRKLSQSGEVLQSLLQDSNQPISRQFLRWRLWTKWPEVVGPTLAKRCYPVGFADGTLWIFVASSSWMQELTFVSGELQSKINKFVGCEYVTQIRFTTDHRAVPRPGGNVAEQALANLFGNDSKK